MSGGLKLAARLGQVSGFSQHINESICGGISGLRISGIPGGVCKHELQANFGLAEF